MKRKSFLLILLALVAFGQTAWAWSGSGTSSDPYLITSTADWNTLATNVNNGNTYSGEYFKLTANIEVSEMVGTDSHRFSGIFDGGGYMLTFNKGTANNRFGEGYCGPFRYINNATIKRLHVAGAIYTSNQFAGMVGHAKGTNYIQSCHCSLTINSSRDGDGTHGGFIANNNQTSYLTNCLFDGSFISTLTTNCGGFIGWTGSGHAYFTNCLFAPTNISFTNSSSCKTFARYNGSNADYTKSYYKQTFGDAQGTNASSMNNEQLLAALGGMWETSGNAVIPIIHPYSLTLAGSGTANDPYQITSTTDWNSFASYVNSGIDFSESYFKLTADITVSEMAGTDANRFNGTFNGDGHTLTFNKGTSGSYFDEKCCGPFRYIDGATFKRLHMAGSIYTSNQNAGMVGNAKGTNNFQSCHCSLTINSSMEGDGTHGGFIANNNNGAKSYFTNCLFDGSFISTTTTNCGGFIGWTEGNKSSKAYFTNCLFAPSSISMSSGDTGSKTFSRSRNTSDVSISNSYYKQTLGDAQGTDASSMSNDALVAALGSGWQISGGKVVPVMQIQALIGSGTEGDPYRIASTADWNILASNVSVFGETYENKYFVLDAANITVSTMVGSAGSDFVYVDQCNYFGGVFDGQGNTLTFNKTAANHDFTAPFRSVYGATIQNLKVEGTINGGEYKLCAGLVGDSYGATTIQNCVSNVNITGNHEDATYGGFIARNSRNETHLYGCAFTGSMSGNGKSCGGFVGWTAGNQDAHVYFHDCIYAPSSNTMGTDGSATYSRGYENHTQNIHYDNCYYTQSFGTEQGKQADTITSANNNVSLAFAGNPSSNTTLGVIGYGTGIKYNNVLYAGNGDEVSLNLTVPMGMVINSATYTPVGGSAAAMTHQTGNVYSFIMPDANVTINVETGYWVEGSGTSTDPFQIATTDDFDMLSTLVRDVPSNHPFYTHGPDQIFSGYYFILINDLNYTGKTFTPVGSYDSRGFKGNFDGQGHVIKGINYEATTGSAGVFGFASGNISNLALVSSNITGGNNTGGIVGCFTGNTISNCHVASDVNIYTPTGSTIVGWHGGIVGRKYAGTISYCTSAAHIVDGCTTYGNYFGGISGNNDTNHNITNCLFTNDIVTIHNTDNKGPIAGSNHGTLTNCYWTNPSFGTGSGDVALAPSTNYDNSGFINTITVIQNKMTVASYSPAFKALAPIGLTISAWNNNDNPVGGWYFIASPVVGDIAPDAVMNLLGTQIPNSSLYNFDLYRFNQSPDMINGEYKEWENYHQHNETEEPFLLENGKGYLYARSEETTLTFTGTFNTSTEPVDVTLTYETTNPKAIMHGWNLVGNPFPVTAYVNRPFYKMNDAGTGIVPVVNDFNSYTPTTIPTCTGIMVQTTADEVTQGTNKVTFSTTVPTQQATNNGNLQIALSQSNTRGNALLDNAIVSFNEGSKLGKFYFGEQNANIYIPQNAEEYAIAYSNKQGEMPLNFKATKDGEYSLNVNPENVEMSYLHLIDNMTGADVDLLAANGGDAMNRVSTYTFTAKTTDYESRFKLVFSANNNGDDASTGSATFAFYSNGNWVIANEGEATLQVVDLMGRILSSETVNGSVSKSINAVPGVYMIRLINGENVKVQKIVVR